MIIINLKNGTSELCDDLARYSSLINNIYYNEDNDFSNGETKQNESLDLKWVETKLFNYYKEFCNILFTVNNKIISESAKEFLDALDISELFKLLNLCNFLENNSLINLIKEKIDDEISNNTYEDIFTKYDINNEINNDANLLKQIEIMKECSVVEHTSDDNTSDEDDNDDY